jgi:hypothetical protein
VQTTLAAEAHPVERQYLFEEHNNNKKKKKKSSSKLISPAQLESYVNGVSIPRLVHVSKETVFQSGIFPSPLRQDEG